MIPDSREDVSPGKRARMTDEEETSGAQGASADPKPPDQPSPLVARKNRAKQNLKALIERLRTPVRHGPIDDQSVGDHRSHRKVDTAGRDGSHNAGTAVDSAVRAQQGGTDDHRAVTDLDAAVQENRAEDSCTARDGG